MTNTVACGEASVFRAAAAMPAAPYPPADGYQLVLQDMAEKNPRAAQANVKDFIDTRFVKELEDSGFIKNLSRK